MMSVTDQITEWFSRVKRAGLVLPDGWFGRPYDNIFHLSYVKQRPHKLIIELDDQWLLVMTDVGGISVRDDLLSLEGFVQLVFDWQQMDNLQPHVKVFNSGTLRFVSYSSNTSPVDLDGKLCE